jgi:hypothetical protein
MGSWLHFSFDEGIAKFSILIAKRLTPFMILNSERGTTKCN